jgi:hypothetical protein
MGLSIPGRGVQAPTLGYELDSFQVQALDELGRNTMSRNNADNAAAAGLVTPREEAVGVGINPPYLPGHEFMLPGVNAVLILEFAHRMTHYPISSPSPLQAALVTVSFFPQVLAPGIPIRSMC